MGPTRKRTPMEHLLRAVNHASTQLKVEEALNRGLVSQVSTAGTHKLFDPLTTTHERMKNVMTSESMTKKPSLKPFASNLSISSPNPFHRIGYKACSYNYGRKTFHNVNITRDRYLRMPISNKPAARLRSVIRLGSTSSTTKSGLDINSAPACSNKCNSTLSSMQTSPDSEHNSVAATDMGFDEDCDEDDEQSDNGEDEQKQDDEEM